MLASARQPLALKPPCAYQRAMTSTCTKFRQPPFKIGDVEIRNCAFLAPMSGVSDAPFRRLAWQFGAGMVVSEMAASEALTTGQEEMRLKVENAGLPVHIVQLAGKDVRWMREAVQIAEQSGAHIIDINMGCPSKRVTNGYAGSALMRDLDHAKTLIDAVVETASVPVTLKMRLGWDENSINAPQLAEVAEDAGVKMITVHGRTRNQFYKGEANWDRVVDVCSAMSLPLVVNGDIATAEDARAAMAASGADAVMIGRAAYGAPWLPGQIGAALDDLPEPERPVGAAFAQMIAGHYEAMLSHYGTDLGIRNARKHLGWYFQWIDMAAVPSAHRKRLMTSTDTAEVFALIADIFGVMDESRIAA